MEIAILILIIVLCLCLVYVTEIMKKMCDRMNWLQDQFSSFKDYNDKEYAEIMKQVNDLRSRLKSLEYKVIEDENDNCDNFYTVHSKIYTMGCRVKKNEEDTYNAIKDNEEHYNKQISSLHDEISLLRDQLKLIEDRVEKYKDGTSDNLCTVHSQINALNSRVKKNEEDTNNDINSRLKSLEDKVKKDEVCLYDEAYGLRARLNALDYRVKKNEDNTYKIVKDNEEYFNVQYSRLHFAINENKEMLNKICTEMPNKEKEENE